MPLKRKLHHSQFPAMPCRATIPVTARGVSEAKVVAIMEVPASHHLVSRPVTKKSLVLALAFFRKYNPTSRLNRKYAATTSQSSQLSFIVRDTQDSAATLSLTE